MLFLLSALSLFVAAMVLAVWADLHSMTIPNPLVAMVIVAFALFALSGELSQSSFGWHLLVGLAALTLTFAAFAFGWMGGGDAKLIAATALWFGPTAELWDYLFLASLFGGILTLALLLARACLSPTTGRVSVDRLLNPASGVPYGVALGTAGLVVVSRFPQMQSLFDLI